MSKHLQLTVLFAVAAFSLSACVPLVPATAEPVSEAYVQTAVAGTLAAERALAAGAELSFTSTPEGEEGEEGEEDGTPEADATLEATATTEGEDPEPEPDNPWMLQNWCEDHMEGCVFYDLQNRTDSWLQVELKETETGVTGFFTVRSKTIGRITLIPGQYNIQYTWWCDGDMGTLSVIKAVGSWVDVFKCPQGFYQRVDKK